MKHITFLCGLCAVTLLGGVAQGAPRRARARPKISPVAVKAPATEVTVSEQSATDIRGFGTVTTWTLRSDGKVVRQGNLPGENMGDAGQAFREHGTFYPGDFKSLVAYVESSRLLDIKVPKAQEMEGTTSFSIVRGGKRRAVVVPHSASGSAAFWVTEKLVRGITSEVDWKNDAGLSVNTGLRVEFAVPEDLRVGFKGDFPFFSVRNESGKEVAEALVQDSSLGIRQPLPPCSYTIVRKAPPIANSDPSKLQWRATPSSFQIEEGSYTRVTIAAAKAPATP